MCAIVPVVAPELLTANEVMERLRVSRSTIARWQLDGTLQPVKIGGALRFRRADIDRLLEPAPVDKAAR